MLRAISCCRRILIVWNTKSHIFIGKRNHFVGACLNNYLILTRASLVIFGYHTQYPHYNTHCTQSLLEFVADNQNIPLCSYISISYCLIIISLINFIYPHKTNRLGEVLLTGDQQYINTTF